MKPTPEQIAKWRGRDYSWSQHSSFIYDPNQWMMRYVFEIPTVVTPELSFGKTFADAAEKRTPLAPVTLLARTEQDFKVPFDGIKLIGYLDTFCTDTLSKIGEFKTGMKAWDQSRVDNHGQLDFYCLLNLLGNGIKPEDTEIFLEWVQTERKHITERDENGFDYKMVFATDPPEVHHFKTARTMQQVLAFGNDIKRTRQEMERYIENYGTTT